MRIGWSALQKRLQEKPFQLVAALIALARQTQNYNSLHFK
jgi:hypothetical protein